MVSASEVSKTYGEKRALLPTTFTLEKGDFFGCFGPNGAGKSTLLKILTGQIEPSTGHATVMGFDVGKQPMEVKRSIGIVPEFESPPSFLTAREFMYFVATIRELTGRDDVVRHWLDFFDLEDDAGVLCRDLSKGQRQKVMLAAAFMHDPPLLFLDEPFINLDPIYQRKLRSWLVSYVKRGGTIFMCTHILEIASRLCRKVMVMDHGKVLARGRLKDIELREGEGLERVFHRLVGARA